VYANNYVYEGVTGWEAFEPALSRAEQMDAHTIRQCAAGIPEEWYEGDRIGLERLVETLHPSTAYDPEVDRRISKIEPKPVSELV
jgi:hypothetical protein